MLYKLDEGAGLTVRDTALLGAPLDLQLTQAGAVWVDDGVEFDGTGRAFSSAPADKLLSGLTLAPGVSVECWITPLDGLGDGPDRVFDWGQGAGIQNLTLGIGRFQDPASSFAFRLRADAENVQGLPEFRAGAAAPALQHVVVTWDDVTDTQTLYLNGALVDSGPRVGALSFFDPHKVALGDAVDPPDTLRGFRGRIHLFALYARALSPFEVAQNFAVGARP